MARMILLGVGTGVPDADRENTHLVWDGPGGPLLIDAGGSTYQRLLRAGIDPQQLRGVLLTHTHPDHINSLPVLLFSMALAGRTEPLPIYGLEPTLDRARQIIAAFDAEGYSAPVAWHPIVAGDDIALAEGWLLRTAPTVHSRPCVALRFEQQAGSRALVYSCDTEPCPAVAALAAGAAILVHEATIAQPAPNHTTPRQAGTIAAHAGVEHLVLVHFSPRWTMPEAQALAEIEAGGFSGQAEIGQEFQVLTL